MRKLANSELHRLDIEQFKKAEKTRKDTFNSNFG